jgi:hypothetical protein
MQVVHVTTKVKVTSRLAVCRQSICFGVKPLETHDQSFFPQLNRWGNSPYGTSSLTRRWVYNNQCALIIYNNLVRTSQETRRDSAVGIATGHKLNNLGVWLRVSVWSRIFTSPCRPGRLFGPPNLLSNGYWGSFPGVKRPGCEADHSPTTSVEVKKKWTHTTTPPYSFMA